MMQNRSNGGGRKGCAEAHLRGRNDLRNKFSDFFPQTLRWAVEIRQSVVAFGVFPLYELSP